MWYRTKIRGSTLRRPRDGYIRMDSHVSTKAAPCSSAEEQSASHSLTEKGHRRRKRPRSWGRRTRAKLMPLFWILIALIGLYFVVRTVLSMTALQ